MGRALLPVRAPDDTRVCKAPDLCAALGPPLDTHSTSLHLNTVAQPEGASKVYSTMLTLVFEPRRGRLQTESTDAHRKG